MCWSSMRLSLVCDGGWEILIGIMILWRASLILMCAGGSSMMGGIWDRAWGGVIVNVIKIVIKIEVTPNLSCC